MILEFNWNFVPERKFTNIEIHPCKEEEGHVTQCEPEEAHFYSLYLHYDPYEPKDRKDNPTGFGGLDCIADTDTEEEAEQIKTFLMNLITNYNGKDNS